MRGLRVTADWHRFVDGLAANDAAPMSVAVDFILDTQESGLVLAHLGDMVDAWNRITVPRLVKYNKPVFEALASLTPKPILLRGNHDSDPMGVSLDSVLLKEYGLEMFDFYADSEVGALHSHIFDEYNAPGRLVGWILSEFCGFLERWVHKDIDLWWNKIGRKFPGTRSRVNYPEECAKLTKGPTRHDPGYFFGGQTTMFFGHTHRRGHWKICGVDVYNPGHAVNGHFQYFDMINGEFQGFKEWPLR